MNKYIPYNITCPLASCSRSNTCARYANYQKAKAEEASFIILNTDLLQVEGEGCPYHLVYEHHAGLEVSPVSAIPSHRAMPDI